MRPVLLHWCRALGRSLLRVATLLLLLTALAAAESEGLSTLDEASSASDSAGVAEEPFISDELYRRAGMGVETRSGEAPPPVADTLGKMGGALMLVLALVAAGAWLARRTLARRRIAGPGQRHLALLETMPLGLKRSVSVLRLGGRLLVVGQSEQGLCALADWPVQELLEPPPAEPAEQPAAAASCPGIGADSLRARDDERPSPVLLEQALAAHAQAQQRAVVPEAASRISRFQDRLRAVLAGDAR